MIGAPQYFVVRSNEAHGKNEPTEQDFTPLDYVTHAVGEAKRERYVASRMSAANWLTCQPQSGKTIYFDRSFVASLGSVWPRFYFVDANAYV